MDRWRDLVTAPLKWLISRRRWRRCVVLNIPPFAIFGENIVTYDQIKRSFYFWYFQNQRVAEDVVRAGDFAFIDRIWADWSPGYDASEDLPKVKERIRDPAHFKAALGYYWGQFDPQPVRVGGMGS